MEVTARASASVAVRRRTAWAVAGEVEGVMPMAAVPVAAAPLVLQAVLPQAVVVCPDRRGPQRLPVPDRRIV